MTVQGARWYGGSWRVRYRTESDGSSTWGQFTATKGRQRVTWKGYS